MLYPGPAKRDDGVACLCLPYRLDSQRAVGGRFYVEAAGKIGHLRENGAALTAGGW